MSLLFPIFTLAVSITIPLLPIITISTYYYVFETGQLADEGGPWGGSDASTQIDKREGRGRMRWMWSVQSSTQARHSSVPLRTRARPASRGNVGYYVACPALCCAELN